MNLVERIVSLYAPHACAGCGREGALLCMTCITMLPEPESCCYLCRASTRHGRTCRQCRSETCLVSVNSATRYAGAAKGLIWSLKFDRAQAAADIAGRLLAVRYGRQLDGDVLVVPVPTASKRIRKRGYDQAVLIARSFARHAGCKYAPLLVRYGAQEQIGASRQQRHDQLRGVFSLKKPGAVSGARIILIDDVLTTGATMEEAAALLKAHGAAAVGALVFARA